MKISEAILLLDKSKCLANIEFMVSKAKNTNILLRPHFKTHQSAEIGLWFRQLGCSTCTVASVEMAEYFAQNGWNNITLAIPLNILQFKSVENLAKEISLNIVLDNLQTAIFVAKNTKTALGVFIKIDTGYGRAGVLAENLAAIDELLNEISTNNRLQFKGFLSHFGHTYKAQSAGEIKKIYAEGLTQLSVLKNVYKSKFPELIISIGDTPGATLLDSFEGADEIRPGNFVFYDLMQESLGVCNHNQIAIALAAPVIGIYPEQNKVLLHAGAVHFSKEYLPANVKKVFGLPVIINQNSWSEPIPDCYLASVSQEHGVLYATNELISELKIGSIIGILPVHSCLTGQAMKSYRTLNGEHIDTMHSF